MNDLLLVIDMQNICMGKNHAKIFQYDKIGLLKRINQRISEFEPKNVYYIKNVMKKNFLNRFAPFQAYEGMEETELVDGLNIVSNQIFSKYTGNAFTNLKFAEKIQKDGYECLELAGVDGGGCVALTALGAIKLGYKVIIPNNLVGTVMVKQEQKYHKKLIKKGVIFSS